MMAEVRAIQTRYAGCHFRSRLEAKWAVFFDRLGIAWEYEAQGYVVTTRLSNLNRTTFPYLPDFWLPDLGVFAEVKGSLTGEECVRLLDAAASLSSNNGGGHDVVVLGPVPRDYSLPARLHMCKGVLLASPFDILRSEPGNPCNGWPIAHDTGGAMFEGSYLCRDPGEEMADVTGQWLLGGVRTHATDARRYSGAIDAARSARFEFGQSG